MTITLTREEAQQVLAVLDDLSPQHGRPDDVEDAIETLRARLAQPEPEREQGDMPCIEDDGCPTEKAVLQRFWRKHQQPEPEPVAWTVGGLITDFSRDFSAYKTKTYTRPLYTAPPQRQWQGLTEQEHANIAVDAGCASADWVFYGAAVERALKEKNK